MKPDVLWLKAFWTWFGGLMLFFNFTVLPSIYGIIQFRSNPLSREQTAEMFMVLTICFAVLVCCYSLLLVNDPDEETVATTSRAQKTYRALRLRVLAKNGRKMALYSNPVGLILAFWLFSWNWMMYWGKRLHAGSDPQRRKA